MQAEISAHELTLEELRKNSRSQPPTSPEGRTARGGSQMDVVQVTRGRDMLTVITWMPLVFFLMWTVRRVTHCRRIAFQAERQQQIVACVEDIECDSIVELRRDSKLGLEVTVISLSLMQNSHQFCAANPPATTQSWAVDARLTFTLSTWQMLWVLGSWL